MVMHATAWRNAHDLAVRKRFVLLTFEHRPFAIGKLVNGTVKNFYQSLRVLVGLQFSISILKSNPKGC